MTNTENANAVMASRKVVIADLIRKLQEQVAALPDDTKGDWRHVGDAGNIVGRLSDLVEGDR